MRTLTLYLSATSLALFALWPSLGAAQVAPRIVIAFDTSGTMAVDLNGRLTFGDGVTTNCSGTGSNSDPYCGQNCTAGIDTDCNGFPDDSRMYVAKNAVSDMILAFGDVDWALARFPQSQGVDESCLDVNDFECRSAGGSAVYVTSYGNPQCNAGSIITGDNCARNLNASTGFASGCAPNGGSRPWLRLHNGSSPDVCTNYDGFCGAGDLLVGFPDMGPFDGMDNVAALLAWMDHEESNFINTTAEGNFCNHANSGDCELRPEGPTPLAGLISTSGDYLTGVRSGDAQSECRNYSIILITDGVESCLGDPSGSAQQYFLDEGIRTYVVGLAISSGSQTTLNAIADAGGTNAAFFANDPVTLSAGLAAIVADSLVNEVCNGADDDCDGNIDEGVTNACGTCGPTPVETCDGAGDEDCDGTVDEGVQNACGACGAVPAEVCNGSDDDCDGPIDEGVCGGCTPTAEICDGVDNDCDGDTDESLTRSCGTDVGECVSGDETCVDGDWEGCDAIGPTPEVCNGDDDDCDGVIDGNQRPCGDDTGACQAGNQVCTNNVWGECVGEVLGGAELCNGIDDDCDGDTDEGNPGGGAGCGSDVGECAPGVRTCTGGVLTCVGGVSPSPETCDGDDEDCDGVTDEEVPSAGACGSDEGACRQGALQCQSGAFVCVGGQGPVAEVCNGIDDDCMGDIDEGNPGSGAACGTDEGACTLGMTTCSSGTLTCAGGTGPVAETCDDVDEDCDGTVDEDVGSAGSCGTDTGECRQGILQCSGGDFVCVGGIEPSPEACNGLDDDCDGVVDDGNPGSGAACGTDVGACAFGALTCSGGVLVCGGNVGPTAEACNGVDDDCDGETDEGNPEGGGICGTDVGECSIGTFVCTDGGLVCTGAVGATPESCDGLDNDCDASVDEMNPGGGAACGSDVGACAEGSLACVGGSLVCSGAVEPTVDLCDGIDNDCDGPIDEGNPGGGGTCGSTIGVCTLGTLACDGGSLVCQGGVRPSAEGCNALDDDCDGSVDEEVPTMGACGSAEGECSEGVNRCVGGDYECVGDRGPVDEICDGRDNDCDASTDEENPGGGAACGTATGECALGTSVCSGGALICSGDIGPVAEVCNGDDDDCDGLIDEGNPGGGGACGDDEDGECELGAEACMGGMLVCVGATGPTAEICDGLDNDCDQLIDEGDPEGGAACGDDTGECVPGIGRCVSGALVCEGAIGPTAEICDGLDNDCDGIPDDGLAVGAPCGTDTGECVPGLLVCRDGGLVCEGNLDPLEESCDSLDNDCDGSVDEGLSLGDACGLEEGLCMPGALQCISGREICVGEVPAGREACDCEDNDCDGAIDEDPTTGSLCPGESACVDCQCALPCMASEFGFTCPSGRAALVEGDECHCVAEQCNAESCSAETIEQGDAVVCAPGSDEVSSCVCRNNACTFPCDGVVCAEGTVCDPRDPAGRCVERSCRALGCGADEVCDVVSGECVADPCAALECGDEACRDGACEASCAEVSCGDGERCSAGACVDDPCAGVDCADGLYCDASGACADDLCVDTRCPTGSICDPATGECERDPCDTLRCPEGQLCEDGECALEAPAEVDAGVDAGSSGGIDAGPPSDERDRVLAAGGCMCRVGATPQPGGGAALMAALLLGLLVVRRRRAGRGRSRAARRLTARRIAALVIGGATTVGASGCEVDPFCLDCVDGAVVADAGRDAGPRDAGRRDAGPRDAGTDGGPYDGCSPLAVELCNGADDDCDAETDEGYDLETSLDHCGACNEPCQPAHAFGECAAGACGVASCDVGFHDLDDDPANGCEYRCLATDDDDAVCDLRDNDCDGLVDEDVARDVDDANCGMCGRVCRFPHNAAGCTGGVCVLGVCEPGFHDLDGVEANGCEYACVPADPATEVCNARDDDCDGTVDEGDPGGGVSCGEDEGECATGTTRCVGGAVICEGEVTPDNETCDGTDEDCDGEIDEGDPEGGALCGIATGTCEQGRLTCLPGGLECVGGTSPGTEVCNGLDDDCDTRIDEGDPGGGGSCGTDEGQCSAGVEHCRGGVIACEGAIGGSDEVCDGEDDDCDGTVDEDSPGVGASCGTDVGACVPGTRACTAGSLVCVGATAGTGEVCNGLDDDCDGTVDEDDPGGGGSCGTDEGVCAAGVEHCVGGTLLCQGQVSGAAESCNGLDDDCDGNVDENDPGGGASCGSALGECTVGALSCTGGNLVCTGGARPSTEVCDGLDQDCDGRTDEGVPSDGACGIDTGECSLGLRVCRGGEYVCTGGTGSSPEVCDGRDNDCDGDTDENDPGGGGACGDATGECTQGSLSCTGGALVCVGGTGPAIELCNGLDDDCDNSVDEGNPGGGALCGDGTGQCVEGREQCVGGAIECVGGTGPAPESCNGLDDDCDGDTDEENPGGGASCGIDTGECSFGVRTCVSGGFTCVGGTGPSEEICDGLDNDCDGVVDDGNPGGGALCGNGTGECTQGTRQCVSGSLQCVGGTGASAEACDLLDNDCDGNIDEDNPEGGALCGNGTGECSQGTQVCSGGTLTCSGGSSPALELCNGLDDDCDGATDEDFDFDTSLAHCGGCNQPCAFANASASCTAPMPPGDPGGCAMGACAPGWYDFDGLETNGCETACDFNGAEVCNGDDDDCDGATDEGLTPPSNFCNPNGVCAGAAIQCTDAGWVCDYPDEYPAGAYQPGGESLCDGLDNDCDGFEDEGYPSVGTSCGNGSGECRTTGTIECNGAGDGVTCTAPPPLPPSVEACDDRDNDCDGTIDEAIDPSTIPTVTLMGASGPFDVFVYEASRPDADDLGPGDVSTVACSRGDVIPWTNVTWQAAQDACCAINPSGTCEADESGWRLCDAEDWQVACEGEDDCTWAYGASCSSSQPLECNGREYGTEALFTTESATFAMCYADHGAGELVYDMSGNAKEWTATEAAPGIHQIRGGSYNNVEQGRTCGFDFTTGDEEFAFPTTGFRCCRY